jgi:hypothetical protein
MFKRRQRVVRAGHTYTLDGEPHTFPHLSGGPAFPIMADSVARELKALYVAFRTVCEKHHLAHWASDGTLLGAMRHRGFIPWDDDVDLHLHRRDLPLLLSDAVQRDLRTANLELAHNPYFGRTDMLKVVRPLAYAGEMTHRWLDLFFEAYSPHDGLVGTCSSLDLTAPCWHYVSEVWRASDVLPLTQAPFEDTYIWIPHNPTAILRHMYGPDVMTTGKQTHVHPPEPLAPYIRQQHRSSVGGINGGTVRASGCVTPNGGGEV